MQINSWYLSNGNRGGSSSQHHVRTQRSGTAIIRVIPMSASVTFTTPPGNDRGAEHVNGENRPGPTAHHPSAIRVRPRPAAATHHPPTRVLAKPVALQARPKIPCSSGTSCTRPPDAPSRR